MFTVSCREPFDPAISFKEINLLVVEGYINAGPGKSEIRLSHVSPLDQSQTAQFEEGAEVLIESDNNEIFALHESGSGLYRSEELSLPVTKRYRLRITLQNDKEYTSEFSPVKITPPIDSISWQLNPDFLYVYVTTHDAQNATRYYQWTFEEDWEIRAAQFSKWKYENDTIFPRPGTEAISIWRCWKSNKSSDLVFTSTAGLTIDTVRHQLSAIGHGDERVQVMYSIIVHQHALHQREFEYLTLVQKNTTQVGSLYDPMPSQLYGNIHSTTDSKEAVIGYVGAYTTENKRIFIDDKDLPSVPSGKICDTISFQSIPSAMEYYFSRPAWTPDDTIYYRTINGVDSIPWARAIETVCVDCRFYGSNVKPDFWIN